MKNKTLHLENIGKSKFTSISTFHGLSTKRIMAQKIRQNKFTTRYTNAFKVGSFRTIVPPKNTF
jgi:hypothetical protein